LGFWGGGRRKRLESFLGVTAATTSYEYKESFTTRMATLSRSLGRCARCRGADRAKGAKNPQSQL